MKCFFKFIFNNLWQPPIFQLGSDLAQLEFEQYFEFLNNNHGRFQQYLRKGGNRQPRISSIGAVTVHDNLTAPLIVVLTQVDNIATVKALVQDMHVLCGLHE